MVTTQKPYFCWLPEASLEASAAAFLVSNSSLSKLLPLWPSSTSWRASSWSWRSNNTDLLSWRWLDNMKKINKSCRSTICPGMAFLDKQASVFMTHLCGFELKCYLYQSNFSIYAIYMTKWHELCWQFHGCQNQGFFATCHCSLVKPGLYHFHMI